MIADRHQLRSPLTRANPLHTQARPLAEYGGNQTPSLLANIPNAGLQIGHACTRRCVPSSVTKKCQAMNLCTEIQSTGCTTKLRYHYVSALKH